jgi:hypothetical protein
MHAPLLFELPYFAFGDECARRVPGIANPTCPIVDRGLDSSGKRPFLMAVALETVVEELEDVLAPLAK